MKKYLLISLFILGFFSCKKKEDPKPDCENNNTGTVTVSNNSSNPYDIYIDDVFKMQLAGKAISAKITVSEGNNRKLYAKQVSGYLLYATEKTTYFNAIRCSDYGWQIP